MNNLRKDLKYQTMGADEPELVSDQELAAFKPEQGVLENLKATYNLSAMDTTFQSALQYNEIYQAESKGGELLPVEKLKEAYPDLPGLFKEPKSAAVAQIIADRTRARNELSKQVSEGPQGAIYGVSRFVAASLPHAIDPANIGAGIAVSALTAGFGGPVVAGIRATAMGARALEVAAVAAKAAPNVAKFAAASAEAFAGNVVGEGAVYASANQEGREYSLEDAFYNTVGGSLMIPGAVLGFNKIGNLAPLRAAGKFTVNRMAAALNRIDPKYGEMLVKTSVARVRADKLPVADVIADHAIKELSGETPSFAKTSQYVREPLTPDRPLYAATYEPGPIGEVQTEVHDEFFGNAAYLSDDPRVANGAGARSIKEGTGRVIELGHDDLNLIDLNQPAAPEIRTAFSEAGVDVPEGRPLMETMRSIQDRVQEGDLPPETLDLLNERLKTQGYDGYLHDGSNIEGTPREPHNSVAVFNRDKLRELAEHAPEIERLPPADPAMVTRMGEEALSPLSDFVHDNPKAQVAEVERLIAEPVRSERLVEVQAEERAAFEDLASREQQGLLDETELEQVAALRESVTEGDTILQHLKDAASCILLGSE